MIHLFASTLIGMRGNNFISLFVLEQILRADFSSKNFQTFLEIEIDIKWVKLTIYQAHWVLWEMPLGGAKNEHFSCFHSSCRWRFNPKRPGLFGLLNTRGGGGWICPFWKTQSYPSQFHFRATNRVSYESWHILLKFDTLLPK